MSSEDQRLHLRLRRATSSRRRRSTRDALATTRDSVWGVGARRRSSSTSMLALLAIATRRIRVYRFIARIDDAFNTKTNGVESRDADARARRRARHERGRRAHRIGARRTGAANGRGKPRMARDQARVGRDRRPRGGVRRRWRTPWTRDRGRVRGTGALRSGYE